MQHSLRSFLRLRLRCPACLANRLAALWAGWQAPQRFSACLSVPGFAWLDRTDSKQASACWSVSVGGSPLETCGFSPASAGLENATAGSEASRSDEGALSRYAKRIVEGPMQRSLTLTPSASPTLSVFPGGSPMALRAGWRFSPASAEVENATAWRYTARFGVQVSGESRVSGMFSPETYCCSFLIYCDGILMSLMVEFLIYFFKKPTVCS